MQGAVIGCSLLLQSGLDKVHVPYSYGWSIILLTILVKTAIFPITRKQVPLCSPYLKQLVVVAKNALLQKMRNSNNIHSRQFEQHAGRRPFHLLRSLQMFWPFANGMTESSFLSGASAI